MIISFSLRADIEPVIVTVSLKDARIEIDNALVYARNNKNRMVIYLNIGNASVDPKQLLAESGFEQKNLSAKLTHPLDVEDFSPKFAAAFVQYCGSVVYWKIRQHARIAQLYDRADCELVIQNFEALSEDIQLEFVYRLRKAFPIKLRRLIINTLDTANIHHQQRFANTLVMTLGILYGLAFAISGAILVNGLGVTAWQDGWAMLSIGLFGTAILVGFFGGSDFGALLAALVLRRFTPKVSLKMVLLNSGFLPKATINRLTTDVEMDWFNDWIDTIWILVQRYRKI